MRAVIAQDAKPVIVALPVPTPRPGEVLVKVRATALNRADLLQVRGMYPPPPGAPDTLGLELAGEVETLGAGVTAPHPGQRVMALVGGGGYAEYAVVLAEHLMPFPNSWSFVEAAAVPEAFLTAYSNLVEIGHLAAGEVVLVHAGASGVGLAAIQIAKQLGAVVVATASTAKHAVCREHGADLVMDYQHADFAEQVLNAYGGAHLVMDFIGAPYWDANVRALRHWGRLVFVGLMGGAKKEINLSDIMRKRLSVMGSTLRDRTDEEKTGLTQRFSAWAQPHFAAGRLKPSVWRTLPLEDVANAHQLMQENANAGKIVLTVS